MEKHLTANTHISLKKVLVSNFFGGLAWGLGTVIGATIVVALLVGILRMFDYVPGIGDLTKQITNTVDNTSTPVKK